MINIIIFMYQQCKVIIKVPMDDEHSTLKILVVLTKKCEGQRRQPNHHVGLPFEWLVFKDKL